MKVPTYYTPEDIKRHNCEIELHNFWWLARPLSFQGLCLHQRFRAAWVVFTGKADVLVWHEDLEKL